MIFNWTQQPTPFYFVSAQIAEDTLVREAIEFQAPWSFTVTAIVLFFCFSVLLALYLTEVGDVSVRKRIGLAGLRSLLIGLVLFMLYGATSNRFQSDKPLVVVMLDNSASMSRRDGHSEPPITPTRIEQAKQFLLDEKQSVLTWLSENYEVAMMTLDDAFVVDQAPGRTQVEFLRTLKADYASSPIGNRVQEILGRQQGRGVAAIILLTDGNANVGVSLASLSRSAHVPVTCIGLGNEHPPLDVSIDHVSFDQSIFLGDTITFAANIEVHGLANKTIIVALVRNGEEKVATEEVGVTSNSFQEQVRFVDRPLEPGPTFYEIVATEFDEEQNRANNRTNMEVLVKEETLKVLLLQSVPSYEFRAVRSILEREAFVIGTKNWSPIELTTVLQSADPEIDSIDRSMFSNLPANEAGLMEYDVIIFGDVDPMQLSSSIGSELTDFVKEQGRGVIFIAGEKFTPTAFADSKISTLFPFPAETTDEKQNREFRFRKTPIAETLHLLTAFPEDSAVNSEPIFWRHSQLRLRPGVRTLAELVDSANAAVSPAITLHYAGRGRVVFHFFDSFYRLKTDLNDERISDYWLQVVRFLGRHKLDELAQPSIAVRPREPKLGETIFATVNLPTKHLLPNPETIAVTLIDSRFREREIWLSREAASHGYSGEIKNLSAGDYRLRLEVANLPPMETEFSVTARNLELDVQTADFDSLRELANATGGSFYGIENADSLLSEFSTVRTERRRNLKSTPIWNSAPLVLLFLVLISAEWILRRRYGMA